MIVDGYSLHLYCRFGPTGDQTVEHPYEVGAAEYSGGTYAECKKQAIRHKWRFDKDDDVTCPHCIIVEKK